MTRADRAEIMVLRHPQGPYAHDHEHVSAERGAFGLAAGPVGGPALAGRVWPVLAGLGLGALALGPGLRRGFLLSYDMVIVPHQPFTAALAGLAGGPPRAVPSDAVVAAASRALPADLVQKLLLLSIFALACSGVVALLGREPWYARLAAGVFYSWNPFVAERLIIGQWALLLGYAGLPWVLHAVTTAPVASRRGAGHLALAMAPAAIGGFAAMTVTALVALPAAVLARPTGGTAPPGGARLPEGAKPPGGARPPRDARSQEGAGPPGDTGQAGDAGPPGGGGRPVRRRLAAGLAALGMLAVGSLPWLIPSLARPVYAGPAGVAAFAARADTPFGSLGSLVMLGGMWNAQAVPAGYGGWWSALWLALVLAAAAAYLAFGVRPARWPGLGIAALAGLLLASLGVTAPGRGLLRALGMFWPGFAVLRDGQQFIAPLALAEALGAGLLVAWAARSRASRAAIRSGAATCAGRADVGPAAGSRAAGPIIAVALSLAPVLLLPGLAWGAVGRLRPVWYPAPWLNAARLIDGSRARGMVLLLPWAAYRRPAWNGGRALLDPWPRLVARQVIWNDGPRVGEIQMLPDDPAARRLGAVIAGAGPLTPALTAAGVGFVVVDAGPAGPGTTGHAGRLPGCTVVTAAPGLVVYRVPVAARDART